jgi:2-phospho-L-lactate/phosphoenolpyruvate guanylyltransferase
MKYSALIPVKSLNEAKSRLAEYLTPTQRARLVLDMLHHVIGVLHQSTLFSSIVVVSADESVCTQAQSWGTTPFLEEQVGHNPALTMAAIRLHAAGTEVLLTIAADLPLLQPQHIHAMIAQIQHHHIVLVPSQDATGTNAIIMHPPLAIPYVFGLNSYPRFQHEATQRQLSVATYHSLETALDIDTIGDLEIFRQYSKHNPLQQPTAPCG